MRNLETAKRGRNVIHSNLAFLGDSKKTHIPPEFLGESLHSKIVEWNLPETLKTFPVSLLHRTTVAEDMVSTWFLT